MSFNYYRPKSKRKPLPKLVLSLMKEGEIKKKLKELGLPCVGDRKVLELRLQRYITLYNAECDKDDPRSVSELIKQCDEEENLEKRANKLPFIVIFSCLLFLPLPQAFIRLILFFSFF